MQRKPMRIDMKTKLTIKNPWKIATVALAVSVLIILFSGGSLKTTSVSANEVGKKAIDFINNNLVQAGTQVSLVSVEESAGMYKIITSYQGQQIPVYVSKDGSYLFVSQPINMSVEIPKQTEQQTTFDAPDKDKPEANLFVMSFCPYGVLAEKSMKPVVDLLGAKSDIKIRFIVNVGGDTIDSVQSLHGTTEAQEDARQACIMKYYDQKTFWNYLMEIDSNCYGKIDTRNASALDTCWKDAANKTQINITKIEVCSKGSEAVNLLKEDEKLANQYGVQGSPTLIINGEVYNGARDSESFKQAICSGFTTKPSECSQTLSSSSGSAPTGGC